KEFHEWFFYSYKALFEEYYKHSENEIIFFYEKRGTFIKKGKAGLIFGMKGREIEVGIDEPFDEEEFSKRIGNKLFEHTVSKWIKQNLENKDAQYEDLKRECSLKAGENLKEFVEKNLNLDK